MSNEEREVWHCLNNQALLFNVFYKDKVKKLDLNNEIVVKTEDGGSLEDICISHSKQVNNMFVDILNKSAKDFKNVTSLLSFNNEMMMIMNHNSYYKMDSIFKLYNNKPLELQFRGTFPGTGTGLVMASFFNMPILPVNNIPGDIVYLLYMPSLRINLVDSTRKIDNYYETRFNVVMDNNMNRKIEVSDDFGI